LDAALGALAYACVFPPLEAGVKDPLLTKMEKEKK